MDWGAIATFSVAIVGLAAAFTLRIRKLEMEVVAIKARYKSLRSEHNALAGKIEDQGKLLIDIRERVIRVEANVGFMRAHTPKEK